MSHVSLEELEKQVCSSWPVNTPCMGMQESRISWAMQCCHLLPAGGHLCVQGTLPVPRTREHYTGQGLAESSPVQTHPGTHLPQSVWSLAGCCAKKKKKKRPAISIWYFFVLVIFNRRSLTVLQEGWEWGDSKEDQSRQCGKDCRTGWRVAERWQKSVSINEAKTRTQKRRKTYQHTCSSITPAQEQ